MRTYLFYDIETSGLNCCFDQILTFAAIRTDLKLNEIHRKSITIKLRKDIIPSPGAFLTHRLTSKELERGLPEYEAAALIHQMVNQPGTVSLGYNSLGFDDDFLRFTFYRNLFDPYTHQYKNDCSRMDLLPIALLYKIFKPDRLTWPEQDGKPSLKLELISKINGFTLSGRAHDAMADTEATLALARALAKEEAMWHYCRDFFNKTKDQGRIQAIDRIYHPGIGKVRIGIMVSLFFGHEANYMAPVLFVGFSKPYPNQSLWLRLDGDLLLEPNQDKKTGFVSQAFTGIMRKRYGESKIVLPPKERFWRRLSKEARENCEKNLTRLGVNLTAYEEATRFHQEFEYPFIPDLDPDAALYQAGFFSSREKKEMVQFHESSTHKKAENLTFMNSSRVKELAYRVLFRNYLGQLPSSAMLTDTYQCHMERVWSSSDEERIRDFRNDERLTAMAAKEEMLILKNRTGLDEEQHRILAWLGSYIQAI